MKSSEIIKLINDLIEYCKSDKAKRSMIIQKLKELECELNAVLPFD